MNNKKVTTLFLTGIVTASMASSPIWGAITSADEIAEEQILVPEGNDTKESTDSVDKKNTDDTSENNASSDKDISTNSNKTVEKKEIAKPAIPSNFNYLHYL